MATETRRGLHLGVLVGLSTAAYAAALAGVTALQSAADRATLVAREPVARTVEAVASDHDALEQRIQGATERYTSVSAMYADLGPAIDDLEGTLDELADLTGRLGESAAQLPRRVSLPSVGAAPARVSPPSTHAVTRASGG
ncbi:MAG TPA: hypothetical protein VFM38_02795 [Candidatus Limnocylindrales bacterium]|nr:hypothetical protein [Candidatus Limnocylindrales bacterium]